jgi:hypothetical protein
MRFWIDMNAHPDEAQGVVHGTPGYVEIQTHNVDPPGISYIYLVPLDQANFIVAACWGHEFDRFEEYIFDPKLGKHWVSAYSEAWPLFGELFTNAMQGRYSQGSLVNFEDLDDGERKWFVATYVGNIGPYEEVAPLSEDPRIIEAGQLVYLKSASLAEQMLSGEDIPAGTKAMMLARGAFAGYVEGWNKSAVWLTRVQQLAGQ